MLSSDWSYDGCSSDIRALSLELGENNAKNISISGREAAERGPDHARPSPPRLDGIDHTLHLARDQGSISQAQDRRRINHDMIVAFQELIDQELEPRSRQQFSRVRRVWPRWYDRKAQSLRRSDQSVHIVVAEIGRAHV